MSLAASALPRAITFCVLMAVAVVSFVSPPATAAPRVDRPYHPELALVSFDIDRFKEVNDTLGHPEGDRVLRVVAAMIDGTLRRNDVAGRMGGDEFSVALVESEADAGGVYLARLHDAIDERIAHGELPQGFAVSPGVAHFPTDGVSADALFRAADRRLYEVKRARAEPAQAPSPDPPAAATPPRPAQP